ncbi:hypothetical protein [Streptomyces sp. NBC_01262]|uniref:hypothetical protein n=1 Tax=Streptomyces sp. NBC_01262 TaxID=2903803 RepID=UPI002E3540F0|nr:hypothetical protein [Streptomyces sp. NBC_01262]
MPTPQEVSALTESLGAANLINLDASVKDYVSGKNLSPLNDFQEVGDWYIIGGSHYAVVPHWDTAEQ